MCGITGFASVAESAPAPSVLQRMAGALRHRGPDDEGYLYFDRQARRALIAGGGDTPPAVFEADLPYAPSKRLAQLDPGAATVALGSRRLSILDLSPAGHMPLSNAEGTAWIAHNGEVYNFTELRAELAGSGPFFSSTDTEVVLRAYLEWGASAVERFNGMWSFAVWDGRSDKLFCSRDRFGIKPFFYTWDGQTLRFASEIKSLLAGGVEPVPNDAAVYAFLAYGRASHGESTFFDGIRSLPPGHNLELDLRTGQLRVWRYYDVPAGQPKERASWAESVARFRELFRDAVRVRMVSDVPVGACLSGGLDSSSIVCTMSDLLDAESWALPRGVMQKTFSARYRDPRWDEGPFIDAVVERAAVDAHMTYPTGEGLVAALDRLIWHQDEPFGSTSIFAQWCVFESVRAAGVPVTFDGQGADELLAGYLEYHRDHFASLLRAGAFAALLQEARCYRRRHGASWAALAAGTLLALLPNSWSLRARAAARRRQSRAWISRDLVNAHGFTPALYDAVRPQTSNRLDHALYRSYKLSLPALLRYEDRNAMAHSVESRLPFLDVRLVDWVFSTPLRARIEAGVTKRLLREAMHGVLPPAVGSRVDKVAFATPQAEWFRTVLRERLEEIFTSAEFQSRPYYAHASARSLLSEHTHGTRDHAQALWRLLSVELWLRVCVTRYRVRCERGAPA